MRSEAASQDTGLSVLVAIVRVKTRTIDFSVKEKDEARVPTVSGLSECLHSHLPGGEGFFISGTGLGFQTARVRQQKERSEMKKMWGLALASIGIQLQAAQYADSVVSYSAGTGSAKGYDNPNAALGEPSRVTPGQFGGPVDPFSPAYLPEQVVSLGTGGSLTVQFNSPIQNSADHSYGLDFIIFGNNGFQIVNGDFTGGGVTDGSLFGANAGNSTVSVSDDGVTFYELTPSLAPVVDGPFPTDGSGDFSRPPDPALKNSSFNGKDLAGIRQLYGGSGGGAAYDISWARNTAGQPANLDSIRFVQVRVLNGISEIDAVSAVPEPSAALLILSGLAGGLFFKRHRA